MSTLREEISRLIAQGGAPITVADYMELCLFHPRHG